MVKMSRRGLLKKMSDCKDLGYVFTIIRSVPTLVYPDHGVRDATWKANVVFNIVLPEQWIAELQFTGGGWQLAKRFLIYREGQFQLILFTYWHNELLKLVKSLSS